MYVWVPVTRSGKHVLTGHSIAQLLTPLPTQKDPCSEASTPCACLAPGARVNDWALGAHAAGWTDMKDRGYAGHRAEGPVTH